MIIRVCSRASRTLQVLAIVLVPTVAAPLPMDVHVTLMVAAIMEHQGWYCGTERYYLTLK